MTTALDIIKSSLRLVRVIDANETPSAADAEQALFALNSILAMWAAQTANIYRQTEISHPLTVGRSTYTVGTGGDIAYDITKIEMAYIRVGDAVTDIPLWIYTEQQYQDIPNKSSPGQPLAINLRRGQNIRLWPVPPQAYTLRLIVDTPFSDLALNDTVRYPAEYRQALRYCLARDICSEYGSGLWNAELEAKYQEAIDAVKAMNVSQRLSPVKFDLPATYRHDVLFRRRNFPS